MASDARRRLATAGSWATCASLRTATPSAALWASPCSRAWVSRGRPCAAPMPVCCCGACRLPTRQEVTRRWPLGLSRSAVYPSTQPSCTSTRRDAPCWCPRRFATPRRIGHFRSAAPYRSLSVAASAADRAGARRCAARFASCAFGEDENQTQVRSFRSHHAPRPCVPMRTHAYPQPRPRASPMHARESRRLRPSRRGIIRPYAWLSRSRRGVHTHTHLRPRRRLAAAASRRVGL